MAEVSRPGKTAVVFCGARPGKNPVYGEKVAGEQNACKELRKHELLATFFSAVLYRCFLSRELSYTSLSQELGTYLASQGIEVVYGGSRFGCMGRLADAVVRAGGKLTGIVPIFFTGTVSPT